MAIKTLNIDVPARQAAGPAESNQAVARDRRVDRTEDLNEEEIAAVEASEMEGGFEHLNAELDRPGTSVVELGVGFCRRLRARGPTAEGKPADKAFRDSLFEIPDQDPTPARPAGAKIGRKGRGLFLPDEGRG